MFFSLVILFPLWVSCFIEKVFGFFSVHGTWVSQKKIDPCVRVELKEGDSLRIGGSSRVYRLHWVPLSHAYDFGSPFVSASDVPMPEEKEDEIEAEGWEVRITFLFCILLKKSS